MVSSSTWFSPYGIEVLEIPIAIILGCLSAWFFKKAIIGPLIHILISVSSYFWIWIYFYSARTSEFLATHLNDIESFILEAFFIGFTWLLSWGVLKARKKQFN